jgi:hypothetical protein
MKSVAKATMRIKTFNHAILILSISFLVLAMVADVVEQDNLILQSQQIITFLDDSNFQCEKHHLFATPHGSPPSGEITVPVHSLFADFEQPVRRLSPTFFSFLRAPPLS